MFYLGPGETNTFDWLLTQWASTEKVTKQHPREKSLEYARLGAISMSDDTTQKLRDAVRTVPDFPIEGIMFRDITPVLSDGTLYHNRSVHR